MNLANILSDVKAAIGLAKTAMELGVDAKPFIDIALSVANGHVLTADERATMTASENAFREQIDARIAADDADG